MAESYKNLSPLVKSVLNLDGQFTELEHLSREIGKVDMNSDSGLERAQKLMNHFTKCGENVSEEVGHLSAHLNEARVRAEAAAQVVSNCAEQLQTRKTQLNEKIEEFRRLGEKVHALNATLAELKPEEPLSDDDRAKLSMRLSEFETHLHPLIEETNQLKKEAQNSKMKALESQADSLSQRLVSASQKLNALNQPNHLQ